MFLKRRYFLFMIFLVLWVSNLHAVGNSFIGRQNQDSVLVAPSGNNILVRAVSSKKSVYAGESFFVSYYLYSAVAVVDPETIINVKFPDCFQQDVPFKRMEGTKRIGGKDYAVIMLAQYIVIAQKPGVLNLPPIKIDLKVTAPIPGDFFNQEKEITKSFTSAKSVVIVNKLPTAADTSLFTGAIGKFNITGYFRPFKKTKNLLTFHLLINGLGNTKAATINPPHMPEGLEVYNPVTVKHDTLGVKGFENRYEYSYQVVANFQGKYVVPALTFTYFNPDLNQYVVYNSGTYNWDVTTGPVQQIKVVEAKQKPIDYFVKEKLDDKANELYSYSNLFYILFFVGLAILIYSYNVSFFHRQARNLFDAYIKQKNKFDALRNVDKLISVADDVEEDIFWKLLTAILFKYIKGEIKKRNGHISDLALNNEFLSNHLTPAMYPKVANFLTEVEARRFAAVSLEEIDKLNCCRQLKTIVNSLHSNWHE